MGSAPRIIPGRSVEAIPSIPDRLPMSGSKQKSRRLMRHCALSKAFGIALGMCILASALADGLDEPIPSYYQEAGASSIRDAAVQHPSERIDPFTGKVQWHHIDLFIPGNGG